MEIRVLSLDPTEVQVKNLYKNLRWGGINGRLGLTYTPLYKIDNCGTSLVAQWLRIRLPVQGTWVRALVQEEPTCHGATKPVCHNY